MALTLNHNTGLNLNEGASGTITTVTLDFDDSQPDTAIVYKIASLAAHGTILLNGSALGLNGTFTQDDINSNRVTYVHDGSETLSDSFGFSVSDGAGGLVTGQSFAFTVNAVNDAPVGTAPALVTTNINVPVAITGLSISDAEMDPALDEIRAKFVVGNSSGTIQLRTDVPGGLTADQILNNGTGSVYFYNGTTLDQLNATLSASNGVIFTPASGVTGSFQILFAATDGGAWGIDPGGSPEDESFDLSFTVTINAVNTAPTLGTNTGDSVGEGNATLITTAKLEFNDAQQADSAITYTVTGETNGHVRLNNVDIGAGNSFTQADITAGRISFEHNGSETTSASFTFSVSDGAGGTVAGQTFSLTVTPANDTPTITATPTLSIVEHQVVTVNSAMTVADAELDARNGGLGDYAGASFVMNRTFPGTSAQDQYAFDTSGALFTVNGNALQSGGLTFATFLYSAASGSLNINFTSSGTVATTALVNDVLRHLQYINGSDAPSASYILTYGLLDGGADGTQGTGSGKIGSASITVTVTGINDAPVIGQLDGDTGTYTEGASPLLLDAGTVATVTELDSANFAGGLLQVSISGNASAGDVLGIQTGGSPAITLSNGVQAGSIVSVGGFAVGTIRTGADGTGGHDLIIDLAGSAPTPSRVAALLHALTFSSTSDTPSTAQRSVTITLNDGDGTAGGGADTASATVTVGVTQTDDLPAAHDDAATVAENATIAIDILANETDPDGGAAAVLAKVNGVSALSAGSIVTLDSGAKVTVNQDGTLSYDPNGAFNWLISQQTAVLTGAVNTSAVDRFSYELSDGSLAWIEVTVTGVEGPGDELVGAVGNDVLTGLAGSDLFMLDRGGNDEVSGGGGDDILYFGGAYTSDDRIAGGAGTGDCLVLQGDYAAGVSIHTMSGVETLVLMTGSDARYGASGSELNSYYILFEDSILGAGQQLTIQGNRLLAGEALRFDGSAESDGSFRIVGGAGNDILGGGAMNDILMGGLGQDSLRGNGGNDTFVYRSAAESAPGSADTIYDFGQGDRIDLRQIDASLAHGGDDAFAFIGSDAFHHVAGELRVEDAGAGWTVQADVDGDGNADFQLLVYAPGHAINAADFLL